MAFFLGRQRDPPRRIPADSVLSTSLNLKFSAVKDPRYDPDLSRKLGVKFRSVLACPIFNKLSAITSVILCINKRNSHKEKQQFFGEQDQQLVEFIAIQAGGLIGLLLEPATGSELMSADLQSDKIMSKVVQAAYMLVNCECILLYMVDEAAGELLCEVGKDGSNGSRIPLGHGVAGHTALTGRSLNIADGPNEHCRMRIKGRRGAMNG